MDLAAEIEVGLLALADAIFLPNRRPMDHKVTANVYAGRQAYPAAGAEWRSGGRTMTERKDAELALRAMERAGRVRVGRPRTKALWCRLSDAAELETRARIGLPGLESAWLLMGEVARLTDPDGRTLDRVWAAEDVLSRHPWGSPGTDPYRLTQEMALPGLLRGWLRTGVTVLGHCYYGLTAAGRSALDHEPAPDPEHDPDPAAWPLYADKLRAALHSLDTAEPTSDREIGDIPLPVALVRVPVGPWTLDRRPEPETNGEAEPVS